jgi:hypothetical protein
MKHKSYSVSNCSTFAAVSFPQVVSGIPEIRPAVKLDARLKHSGMTAEQLQSVMRERDLR